MSENEFVSELARLNADKGYWWQMRLSYYPHRENPKARVVMGYDRDGVSRAVQMINGA